MYDVSVRLNTVDKVKDFVSKVSKFNCPLDVKAGSRFIDAKSIMGFYTLNLSDPINVKIITGDDGVYRDVVNSISEYLV